MKTYGLNNGLTKTLIFFCLLLTVLGCSKSKDDGGKDGSYYFRAKVNGQSVDFSHTAHFQGGGNDNKWQHIVISGYISPYDSTKPLEQTPHSLGFDLWNEGGDFPVGTYKQYGGGRYDDENPNNYSIDMEYFIQTTGGTVQYDARKTEDFTLKILEISKSTGIKGTFKGTIAHENNINDKKVITDGEFFLPYNKVINPYK